MKQNLLILTAFTLVIITMGWVVAPTAVYAAESLIDATTLVTEGQVFQSGQNAACVNDNTCFVFYLGAEGDLEMASTTDGGATWTAGRTVDSVNTTDVVAHAIWYEGWTATTAPAQYIHIVTVDSGVDDTYYTRYDIANNTLSTTVITSTQAAVAARGSDQSTDIIQTASGRLYLGFMVTEDVWFDTCTTNCTNSANWSEAVTEPFANGDDVVHLAPIGTTDNLMVIQRDFSTDILRWATYAPTSSSWSTVTDIEGSLPENTTDDAMLSSSVFASTTGHVFVSLVDDVGSYSQNTADLAAYFYHPDTGWSIATRPIVNRGGTINGTKAAVDTSSTTAPVFYAFYQARDAVDHTATSTNLFYRTSSDYGSTWSAESAQVNDTTDDLELSMSNGASGDILGAFYRFVTTPNADDLYYNLAVDLTPWTPPGGGGGGGVIPQSEFFFGLVLPYLFRRQRQSGARMSE